MWILLLQHSLSTISSFHTIFMPMEGLHFRWDIDLFGEYYNANYVFFYVYYLYFMFIVLSSLNTQNNYVKMLNNEEIVSFPHYLVVNHCNADDFKLGEPFIVNLWLESVKYSLLFILRNFQFEIPNSCMWN